MAKRRTKKAKQNAKHRVTVNWDNSAYSGTSSLSVNRQKEKQTRKNFSTLDIDKSANNVEQVAFSASVRKDIIKSLALTSFILCLEIVIYFFWK